MFEKRLLGCAVILSLSWLVTGSELKFKYFAVRGIGEISRILLKMSNIPFEDIRYPFAMEADGSFRNEEYQKDKAKGHFATNMNRLPVLEVHGLRIGQSKAIERYIAIKGKLFGETDEERALIDNVAESVREIKDLYYNKVILYPSEKNKDSAKEKWFDEELIEWLEKLEKSLPLNPFGESYIVGKSASYGDIVIWSFLRDFFFNKDGVKAALIKANAKRLTQICDRVEQLPAVKHHLATRPRDPFYG